MPRRGRSSAKVKSAALVDSSVPSVATGVYHLILMTHILVTMRSMANHSYVALTKNFTSTLTTSENIDNQ